MSWFKPNFNLVGIALGAFAAMTALGGTAEAQQPQPQQAQPQAQQQAPLPLHIGAARRVEGAPVAAEAVHARFVFSMGGNRIVFVNQADEVYYHRVNGNHVDMHIRMNGQTVGHLGDPTKYVIAEDNSHILVVTRRGDLYRHEIRAESLGPPVQIPGAPVGTAGQEPVFMFVMGNQLVNATNQGEIWAHTITRTVSPPRRLGRFALAPPRQVRHAFNLGRTVYVIDDQGAVYRHDIHPELGQGRIIASRTLELGQPATRFVFPMGNRLFAVNERGEVWTHDISSLMPRRGAAPPGATPTPAPAQ